MTEKQAIKILKEEKSWESDDRKIDAFIMGIEALEEIQQYRAIGLTPLMVKDLMASEKRAHKTALENANMLDEYRAIGTIEEFKALKEKNVGKKLKHDVCLNCSTNNDKIIKHLGNPQAHKIVYCWNCGQKLDWSE